MSYSARVPILTYLATLPSSKWVATSTLVKRLQLAPSDVNTYVQAASQFGEIEVKSGKVRISQNMRQQFAPAVIAPLPKPANWIRKPQAWEVGVVIIASIVWLSAILAYAMFGTGQIDDRRFILIRTVISLGAAGYGAAIPGFLNVRFVVKHVLAVRAIGAAGFFVIVFFFLPKV